MACSNPEEKNLQVFFWELFERITVADPKQLKHFQRQWISLTIFLRTWIFFQATWWMALT